MTYIIMVEWLRLFDKRAQNPVLLLMDNFSVYEVVAELIRESNQPLKWTRIEWFPANTIERLRLQSIKYVSNIREAGREQGQTCSD